MPDTPLQRLTAALADRYRIEHELGSGGMATVYLAQDLRHDRKVALKVLRPEVAAAVGAERFVREIGVVAKLQHPHIVPLHDSGESDGTLYFIMPYIEGETLRARLSGGTPLAVREAVRLTCEVGDALEYAHRRGIIHRDVKPENILLSGEHALVTDFGIARVVHPAGDVHLTEGGSGLGTPGYMSPEQITASSAVDARSDIYSLGCVLYEMLGGAAPFAGPTVQAVMVKHVTDIAPPPRRLGEDIPPAVVAAVLKALAKDPAARQQSVDAFIAEVNAPFRPAAGSLVGPQSAATIVVLPFENASPDPNDAYFTVGLTDEVISDLSKVRAIRVISRATSMQLKGTTKGLTAIARELNVRYALCGSVRRSGDTLRIVAELVDTATNTSLWGDKFTGTVADVFTLQERLSRQIVDALQVAVTPAESRRHAARPAADPEAYRKLATARDLIWTYDPAAVGRAKILLYELLAAAGDDATVLAWLGGAYVHSYAAATGDPSTYAAVDRYLGKALSLEPDLAIGLAWMAQAESWRRGARASIPWWRKAVAAERTPEALALSYYLAQAGESLEEAVALSAEMVARDPRTPFLRYLRSHTLAWCGDFAGSVAEAQELLKLKWVFRELFAGFAFVWGGLRDKAVECFRRVPVVGRLTPLEFGPSMADAIETGTSRPMSPALERFCTHGQGAAADWAATLCGLTGDRLGVLKWVSIAIDLGFTNERWWGELNPVLAPYRADPDYQALVAKARHIRETEPV